MNSLSQDPIIPQAPVIEVGANDKSPLPKSTLFTRVLVGVVFCLLLFGLGYVFFINYNNHRSVDISPITNNFHPPTNFPDPTISTDTTVSWLSYRNEEYGFEIKYPSDWLTETTSTRSGYYSLGLIPKSTRDEDYSAPYSVNITVYGTNSIDEQINTYNCPSQDCAKLATTTSLGGEKAKKVKYSIVGMEIERIVVEKNNYNYEVTHYVYDHQLQRLVNNEIEQLVFDQIISSFLFTKLDIPKINNPVFENPSNWYIAEVNQKSNAPTPEYFGSAYLRKPISEALQLQTHNDIENIVADARKTKWGSVNFNGSYYIYVSNIQLFEKKYESDSLTVDIKKISNPEIIPYFVDHNYCKQDSDCTIRDAYYCSYGAYNYFESIKDHESGCTGEVYDDEINQSVDTMCHKLTYSNPECSNNVCVSFNRTYEAIACD